jgi:alkylated DNA nucleotide flippase Atl1
MAPSDAFEANTARLLDALDTVPSGRCTTYGALGRAVGIVPRYAALIMARAPEVHTSPWHRVVGADATVRPGGHHGEQIRRLRAEGFRIDGNRIVDFHERFVQPSL